MYLECASMSRHSVSREICIMRLKRAANFLQDEKRAARSRLPRYGVSEGALVRPLAFARAASLLAENPIAPLAALRSSVRPS